MKKAIEDSAGAETISDGPSAPESAYKTHSSQSLVVTSNTKNENTTSALRSSHSLVVKDGTKDPEAHSYKRKQDQIIEMIQSNMKRSEDIS